MRLSSTFALTAGLIGASKALNLIQPRDAAPKVVQHDIQRRHVENPLDRDRQRLQRRASKSVTVTLDNEQTLYFMNITIGTPAQSLRLSIDTGSSDLWVNAASSTLCKSKANPCSASGTYNANGSTTYKYINSDFDITYADETGASGDYVSDTVSFGGVSLEQQQIGVGYKSTSEEAVLGIGYTLDEASTDQELTTYPNIPQHLVQSGVINTNAYSLWLNDLDSASGSILFGGINTGKFQGTLGTMPILKEEGVYSQLVVALTGLGYNGNSGSIASNQAAGVILDSGSSLIYLPDQLADSVFSVLGLTYDESQGSAAIDCDQSNNETTIDFTFSGVTIKVALSELVVLGSYSGYTPQCILGLAPTGDSQAVLGDTFLRSAYVVYDLNSNEISMAQTKFNSTSDNILEITNSSVPSATPVASAVTTVTAEATGAYSSGGTSYTTTIIKSGLAAPTAAVGAGAALLGAAGAGLLAVL